MKGEKRPRLLKREVQDILMMFRTSRKRNVDIARRMEVLSSDERVERKPCTLSCQLRGTVEVAGAVRFKDRRRDSQVRVAFAITASKISAAGSPNKD